MTQQLCHSVLKIVRPNRFIYACKSNQILSRLSLIESPYSSVESQNNANRDLNRIAIDCHNVVAELQFIHSLKILSTQPYHIFLLPKDPYF